MAATDLGRRFTPVPWRPERCRHIDRPTGCVWGDRCKFRHKPLPVPGEGSPRARYWLQNVSYMQREGKTRLLRATLEDNEVLPAAQVADADVWWGASFPSPSLLRQLKPGAWVNHHVRSTELTHKDRLHTTLRTLALLQPQHGWENLAPRSFLLPWEAADLIMAASAAPDSLWIMKQANNGEAKGTYVTQVEEGFQVRPCMEGPVLACLYIPRPLLIENRKVDLRLFVLVTSIDPPVAYLHTCGLVRFAAEDYTLDAGQLDNVYVHLTSNSIHQKKDPRVRDSNWDLRQLAEWLEQTRGAGAFERLWDRLVWVAQHTIAAAVPEMNAAKADERPDSGKVRAFELLGFDVLVDEDLQAWLLEVNSMPDISATSSSFFRTPDEPPANWRVKSRVLADVFSVAMEGASGTGFEVLDVGAAVLGPELWGTMQHDVRQRRAKYSAEDDTLPNIDFESQAIDD